MRRVLLPVLFVAFFLLESLFVELLPGEYFDSDQIFVPRILMIAILFLTIYGGKTHGIVYGFIFGLLFDVVYTEVIGIYLFMFPLIAYLTAMLMKVLQANILISTIVTVLGIILLELGVYELNFLIHITDMPFSMFAEHRLFPTAILNLAFTLVLAFPLKRHFEKWAEEHRNE